MAQKSGEPTIIMEPRVEDLQRAWIQNNRQHAELTGYRVQIYNGRKAACQEKRSEFLRHYPNVKPYTLYDSPEYRVRVGDFRTRLEAERFRNEIIDEFSGSFVVKTEIDFPSLEKPRKRD